MEKISVIIPFYKVEKFASKCIESVINQTYNNLEIILVDDGSTDKCPEICDEYAKQDRRIKVIHKINGGLSEARNTGIDKATGEYITFIDGDDSVDCAYVENLHYILKENSADISVCSWNEVDECVQTPPKTEVFNPADTKKMNTAEALKAMLYQVPFDHSAWGKLYKRELLDEIRFPRGKLYEDIAIQYKLFDKAKIVCYTPYKGYRYILRGEGIERASFSLKKMDLLELADEMKEYVLEHHPDLRPAILSRYIRANFHLYMQIPNDAKFSSEIRQLEYNIRKYRGEVLKDSEARLGTKLAIVLTYFGFSVFRMFGGFRKLGKR